MGEEGVGIIIIIIIIVIIIIVVIWKCDRWWWRFVNVEDWNTVGGGVDDVVGYCCCCWVCRWLCCCRGEFGEAFGIFFFFFFDGLVVVDALALRFLSFWDLMLSRSCIWWFLLLFAANGKSSCKS